MKSRLALSTLAISVTLVGSGAALGQEYKTREQVQAELAEANRDGTILSGDGTLWRDLGSLHYFAAPSFVARSNHTSGTPSMAGTDRSPDMGAGKH